MRLSDILKRTSASPTPAQTTAQVPVPPPTKPPQPSEQFSAAPVSFAAEPQIAPAAAPQSSSAEEVYSRAILKIKEIITGVEKNVPFGGNILIVPELVNAIETQPEEILILADRATPDIYLYGHCVNVTIFSLLLGHTFGFDRQRMIALGFCALLHDIGMVRFLSIVQKKEKLTDAEYAAVRKHPLQGQSIVHQFTGMRAETKAVIIEVMARVHDPKLLNDPEVDRSNDIAAFARIISVADVYEALTHPRSFRDRFLPHEALKTMINTASPDYDSEMLKAFIERISIYPPGSYVRLNTDEIARVTGINRGLPTRPKVKILVGPTRERLPAPRFVDLAATPMIFIKEAVDETRLALPDKKLALELKAVRWWVKGL